MRAPERHRLALALLLALSAAADAARADHDADASEAQLQFQIGRDLYEQHRPNEALQHLLTSHRLVPNARVAINVATVYEAIGQPAEAYNWYEIALSLPLDEALQERAIRARDALAPGLAIVEVVSDPPGALVHLDRVELGAVATAPRRIAVPPGAHTLIARAERHDEARREIDAALGAVVRVELALAPHLGELAVTSDPAGAAVYLEGREAPLGTTPLRASLRAGVHHLLVRRDGYVDQSRTVVLERDRTRAIDVRLAREASTVAVLTVVGTPRGADVLAGGALLGPLPITRSDLPPGPVELEVRRAGRAPFRTSIVVEAGSATRVDVELLPAEAFEWETWRWAGWASAGAFAIVGGVLGGLALQARAEFFAAPDLPRLQAIEPLAHAADVLFALALGAGIATAIGELAAVPPRATSGRVSVDR